MKNIEQLTLNLDELSQEMKDELVLQIVDNKLQLFKLFNIAKNSEQDRIVFEKFFNDGLDIVGNTGAAGNLARVTIEKTIKILRRILL